MDSLRLLLLPFSWLYGLVVIVRNKFYDWGIFPSKEFDFPVIGVGNLSAGGTGKTPHVEYLIRLLQDRYRVATLSRGYGRHSRGFILAKTHSTSYEIGDEPKQYRNKFPATEEGRSLVVAVDADRVNGIKKLMSLEPHPEVILLDDAFQHRAVKPGLNILLTDYSHLYYRDHLLPAGMLREPSSGASRADVIVVTKTPGHFTPMEQRIIVKEINPRPHQSVYFSQITYGQPVSFHNPSAPAPGLEELAAKNYSVQTFTGIANPAPLIAYLKKYFREIKEMAFPDHHEYSVVDLERMKASFNAIENKNKIIITTEKDAMRLDSPGLSEFIKDLHIIYLPIEVHFRDEGEEAFNRRIMEMMKR